MNKTRYFSKQKTRYVARQKQCVLLDKNKMIYWTKTRYFTGQKKLFYWTKTRYLTRKKKYLKRNSYCVNK